MYNYDVTVHCSSSLLLKRGIPLNACWNSRISLFWLSTPFLFTIRLLHPANNKRNFSSNQFHLIYKRITQLGSRFSKRLFPIFTLLLTKGRDGKRAVLDVEMILAIPCPGHYFRLVLNACARSLASALWRIVRQAGAHTRSLSPPPPGEAPARALPIRVRTRRLLHPFVHSEFTVSQLPVHLH